MGSAGYGPAPWDEVYRLAQTLVEMPREQRRSFLDSRNTDPQITLEALQLAERMENSAGTSNDRIGAIVGRFELRRFLGAGGAGEVFAAYDPELHREVAIKILRTEQGTLPEAQERFIREARTASSLNYPNIITIHEVIRTESSLAIAMELVHGVSLREVNGQAPSIERIRSIGAQAAEALAAAHAAGIVHRDIKPENLMVTDGDRVKVLDFGLARLTSTTGQSLQSGLPAGTLRYMSPEHYRGQPLTEKSDIFALGIVLYELATGQHPFGNKTSLDLLHAIATDDVKPPASRSVPKALGVLLLRMLAKNGTDRPTAAEVASELGNRRTSAADSSSPAGRILSPRALILAAIAIAIVAAAVWKLYPAPSRPRTLEQVTHLIPENRAFAGAISGDGKYIAYANSDGVFLLLRSSGETTMLQSPSGVVIDHLQWMPDGVRLIASGMDEESSRLSIWSISGNGGSPVLLREHARFGTPSFDGRQIAFLSADGSTISTMDLSDGALRSVAQAPSNETFRAISWSPTGRHLVVRHRSSLEKGSGESRNANTSEAFHSIDVIDVRTGTLTDRRKAVDAWSSVVLADGTIVFISGYRLGPNGPSSLWSLKMNPATGKLDQQMLPVPTPTGFGDALNYALTSTSDGSTYALLRRQVSESIFVADFDRKALRFSNVTRLSLNDAANYPHGWTADSRSVIFESDRIRGSYDLYKQDLGKRVAEPIVASRDRNEVLAQLAPDQKTLLFASSPTVNSPYALKRVSLEGGVPADVAIDGPLDEFRCGSRPGGRCVLRKTNGTSEFVFFHLDPVEGIRQELARTRWQPAFLGDWDLSPDGQYIAIPNHDPSNAKVRLLRLGPQAGKDAEREITLPGLANIAGLNWAADGTGWFVSVHTNIGRRMYFYGLDGHLNSLGPIQGWAVPSPDGKKVAFVDKIGNDNVWIMQRPRQ